MDSNQKKPTYSKYFLYIATAYSVCSYLHYLLKEIIANRFYDFTWYYTLSQMLRDGCNIWRENLTPEFIGKVAQTSAMLGVSDYSHGIRYITYSPGFYFLFSPFTFFPLKTASLIWCTFSQAAFMIAVFLLIQMMRPKYDWKNAGAVFLVFTFWPLFENAHLAQVNYIILLLFVLAMLSLRRQSLFLAGIFLGAGIQLKEIFLPMLLFVIFKKYWKALYGAILVILLIKGAAILTFGINTEIAYWQHNLHYWITVNNQPHLYLLSISAILTRLAAGVIAPRFIQLLLLPLLIFILWKAWVLVKAKSPGPRDRDITLDLEYSFFIALCFIASPWVNEPGLILLYIPLLAAWSYLADNPVQGDFILFAASYLILGLKYSVVSFPYFWTGLPSLLLGMKAAGYILLFYLLYRILKGPKSVTHDKN